MYRQAPCSRLYQVDLQIESEDVTTLFRDRCIHRMTEAQDNLPASNKQTNNIPIHASKSHTYVTKFLASNSTINPELPKFFYNFHLAEDRQNIKTSDVLQTTDSVRLRAIQQTFQPFVDSIVFHASHCATCANTCMQIYHHYFTR